MPDSLKRMERRRRGKKDPGPDPWELANSVAEYKCFPSDLGPAGSFPPLFPGGCTKCSPLGSFYMVDPVSKILGHVDLTVQGLPGGNMLRQLVVRLYQQLYTGGIIISPGQLEVLVRAGQERTIVLVTEDSLTSTDLGWVGRGNPLPATNYGEARAVLGAWHWHTSHLASTGRCYHVLCVC